MSVNQKYSNFGTISYDVENMTSLSGFDHVIVIITTKAGFDHIIVIIATKACD